MSDKKEPNVRTKVPSRAGIERRGGYSAGDRKPVADWKPPPTGPAPGASPASNGSNTSRPDANESATDRRRNTGN